MAVLCLLGMIFCIILYRVNKKDQEKQTKVDFKVSNSDIM